MAATDRSTVTLAALVVAALLLVTGCSGDGFVASRGTVVCDGEPVADGSISFHPLDTRDAPQGSRIVAGRFRIRVKPGRQRVEIVASRPKADGVEITPGMRPLEQFLPPRYNADSTLEVEVTRGGRNVFDFDLQSSSPAP